METFNGYPAAPVCVTCGGECCKRSAGIAYPLDFAEPLFDSLVAAFRSGRWAIDWVEGEPPIFYVRPRHVGVVELRDPSWGGQCVFLGPFGCELSFNERPTGCRMLEPVEVDGAGPTPCLSHGHDKYRAAKEWKNYQQILLNAEVESGT